MFDMSGIKRSRSQLQKLNPINYRNLICGTIIIKTDEIIKWKVKSKQRGRAKVPLKNRRNPDISHPYPFKE